VKRGTGRWRGDEWSVEVELAVELPTGIRDLARLELVYARDEPEAGAEVSFDPEGAADGATTGEPLAWRGLVYRPAQWRRTADGGLVGLVRSAEPADLWATPFVPETALPGAQLESILRVELTGAATRLRLARMERFARDRDWGAVVGGAGAWTILDETARAVLWLDGLALA
jgi:hypothetical protein